MWILPVLRTENTQISLNFEFRMKPVLLLHFLKVLPHQEVVSPRIDFNFVGVFPRWLTIPWDAQSRRIVVFIAMQSLVSSFFFLG